MKKQYTWIVLKTCIAFQHAHCFRVTQIIKLVTWLSVLINLTPLNCRAICLPRGSNCNTGLFFKLRRLTNPRLINTSTLHQALQKSKNTVKLTQDYFAKHHVPAIGVIRVFLATSIIRFIWSLINGNKKGSLSILGVKMEKWESKCTILEVKENPAGHSGHQVQDPKVVNAWSKIHFVYAYQIWSLQHVCRQMYLQT